MKNRSHGFTLPELMVVLALAAAILAIGAPNFNEFRRNNRLTSVANEFLGTVQTARSEAIKRQVSISVCPSGNPESAEPSCSGGDFLGWIAFVDANNNCERDDDEPVLRAGARINSALAEPMFSTSTGNCISFASTGFTQPIATKTPANRTLFCDSRGLEQKGTTLSASRGIDISPTGRTRVTRVKDDIEKWAIACPGGAEPEEEPAP